MKEFKLLGEIDVMKDAESFDIEFGEDIGELYIVASGLVCENADGNITIYINDVNAVCGSKQSTHTWGINLTWNAVKLNDRWFVAVSGGQTGDFVLNTNYGSPNMLKSVVNKKITDYARKVTIAATIGKFTGGVCHVYGR